MGDVARFYGGGSDLGSVPDFGGVLPQASAFGAPAFSQLPQFPTTSEPGFGIGPDAPTTAPAAAPTPSAALGGAGPAAPAAPAVDQFGNPSNLNPYSGYGNFGPYATPSADQSGAPAGRNPYAGYGNFGPYAAPPATSPGETAATVDNSGAEAPTDGSGGGSEPSTSVGPAGSATPAAGGGSVNQGWWDRNITPFLESVGAVTKPIGVAAGVAGLGKTAYDLFTGAGTQLNPLQQQYANLLQQRTQAAQSMMGGAPTGALQQIDAAQQARDTAIRNKYAQLGMNGSTAENQELAYSQNQATIAKLNLNQTYVNAGAGLLAGTDVPWQNLGNVQQANMNQLYSALGKFASAASAG
jgi:hypothetical protein